ncbi:LCP family protein [Actinomyces sp. MRS3W]|uniref:LCP family glycopolymer transferase n=1 Tax=Actinomyces sp. MRS3W TaxID=2800796 RepID=UPI0028FD34A6|nr:LCP family protein [Actinomyces sp. MRS3W]MDU0347784.1 LCP family protein [Actinomyces sp. MRS3W]
MSSTDDGDLPPSFTPGTGRPRRRTHAHRPPAQQPNHVGTGADRADADAAGAQSGSVPRRPLTPRRAATSSSPGDAGTRSRSRTGSSAVPLGSAPSRPARGPEPTRVMGSRGSAPSARSRGVPRPQAVRSSQLLQAASPGSTPEPQPTPPRRRRRRHPLRWVAAVLVILLALVGARVAWLAHDINSKLQRVQALSGAEDTPGETWLIVGSDSRADGAVGDNTEGARSDSIMLLHKAPGGQASLTSLPRDTYVDIPDYGGNKINAAYSYGGPTLLVTTVEQLTGITIDHYVEVGMGGVSSLVDAVGGVNVCLDYDVDDADSGLVWDTSQGECQDVDGDKALAYSRMRKSDPTGDIGRALRQRAVISAVVSKAISPSTLTSFSQQDTLVDAGTQALTVDEDASTTDLARMLLAFRSASKSGLTGAPPIASLDYEPGGIGAAVLLEDTTAPDFFTKLREGTLTTADFNQS